MVPASHRKAPLRRRFNRPAILTSRRPRPPVSKEGLFRRFGGGDPSKLWVVDTGVETTVDGSHQRAQQSGFSAGRLLRQMGPFDETAPGERDLQPVGIVTPLSKAGGATPPGSQSLRSEGAIGVPWQARSPRVELRVREI